MKRSAWHLRSGAVVGAWLVVLVAVSLLGLLRPVTPALLVHLLLLGTVSNAILIWSAHFAGALLRLSEPGSRRAEAARLVLFNIGAVMVVAGMAADRSAAVLAGCIPVATAAGWHAAVLLRRIRQALPSRFGATVHYYVAAGALLPIGVALGVVLARDDLTGSLHARVALAHVAVNLLGWVAVTVVGTLHGRRGRSRGLSPRAHRRRSTPRGGDPTPAPHQLRDLVGAGGFHLVGRLGGRPRRHRRDRRRLGASSRHRRPAGRGALLVGIAAQVLLGALSYLMPVVLGGGPSITRATTAVLDTFGTARVTVVNLGLLVTTLPLPRLERQLAAALAIAALAVFLPLVVGAVLIGRRRHGRPRSAPR